MFSTGQAVRLTVLRFGIAACVAGICVAPSDLPAQAPASAPAKATPQRGTVKSIDGNNLTLTTDAGQQVLVAVGGSARIQRLAPGSTDLKTAETATLADVAVGDRVLVTGTAGETAAAFNATRVILMKSGDIAQKHEAEQQDWQKRGTGGIVTAVDGSGTISVSSGTRKLAVSTGATTTFRRYADGSVKFEDAKPGTLAQIHVGDQMLARGAKTEDGTSLQAEEVVSGSFKNLSGTLVSIDTARNVVALKDLVTKRNVTVQLTPNSAVHRLPPEVATRMAARAKGRAAADAGAPGGTASPRPAADASSSGTRPEGSGGHSGGGDLSQIVAKLPLVPLSDLHTGDAVMIVAEQSASNADTLTAITLLAGVDPILAAAPSGSAVMTLSPWSVGSSDSGGSQ